MLKKFVISVMSCLMLLSLPAQSFATSWAYPLVVWDNRTYEVTDEVITNVEKEIGEVTKYSDMQSYPGNFSNIYKEGTKYYSVKGSRTKDVIAVEEASGTYKKAVYRFSKQPSRLNSYIKAFIATAGSIAVLIGLFYMINKKRKNAQ